MAVINSDPGRTIRELKVAAEQSRRAISGHVVFYVVALVFYYALGRIWDLDWVVRVLMLFLGPFIISIDIVNILYCKLKIGRIVRQGRGQIFLLLVGKAGEDVAEIDAVRIVPSHENERGWDMVGEAAAVLWAAIRDQGEAAFEALYNLPLPAPEDIDPGTWDSKLGERRALVLEVTKEQIYLSHWYGVEERRTRRGSRQLLRCDLPVTGAQLEEAIREMFESW